MSLDKDVLAELTRQSEIWNQKNVIAPRYGEQPAKLSSGPVTWAAIAPFMVDLLKPLIKRIDELERRPAVKYLGVHKPGATYSEGSLVTRDGSIFHANKTTTAMPGDGSQDWTLAVKRGKDAR